LALGRRQDLPPAVRDRQATVASERLEADLRTRRELPPLVLRSVHEPEHLVHHGHGVTVADEIGETSVSLDVVIEDVVEHLVRGQAVAVLLARA